MADWVRAAARAEAIAAAWGKDAPGGAFVLFGRDGIRASASGGLASLEHGISFTADTPSRYASISKHVLAASLLLAGVELDAALGALLPGLPAAFGAVPLVRALDMTGGLPDMMEVLWQQGAPFTATLSRDEIGAALHRLDATCAPPGTEMAYSNTGWRLGQAVLEARTGVPYARFLHERLLGPLNLPIRFPYDEAEPVPGLATGYWRDRDRWRRGRYGLHVSASGGLVGGAAALAGWAGALMGGRGSLAGVLDRLLAPRRFADGLPSCYRLGLVASSLGGARLAMHGGSLPGYRNHLLLAPDAGAGVVLLMNRDEDPLPPALEVMAALLGEAPPQPMPGLVPGLFAADQGPFWAEVHPGAVEFMGARETLLAEGNTCRSFPGALEIEARLDGDVLEGRFGGVRRTLRRVPDGLSLDPSLPGRWREPVFGAELIVRPDGTALWPFAGGMGQEIPLTPLPGARALATLAHQMWRHRPCLWLHADGTLRVASHRARVLRFARVGDAPG